MDRFRGKLYFAWGGTSGIRSRDHGSEKMTIRWKKKTRLANKFFLEERAKVFRRNTRARVGTGVFPTGFGTFGGQCDRQPGTPAQLGVPTHPGSLGGGRPTRPYHSRLTQVSHQLRFTLYPGWEGKWRGKMRYGRNWGGHPHCGTGAERGPGEQAGCWRSAPAL